MSVDATNAASLRGAAAELRRIALSYGVSADSLDAQAATLEAPAPTKRYVVTGNVFLADGFDYEVDAPDEATAERLAKEWANSNERTWPNAEAQEVCLNSVTEV